MVFASASGSSGGGKPKPKPQPWSSELPTYLTVYVSKPVSQTVEPPIPNDIVAFVSPAPTISTSPRRPSRPAGPGVDPTQPAPGDPPADAERQERPDERRGNNRATQNQAQTKPDYSPDEEEESETAAFSAEIARPNRDLFLSMNAVDLSYYSSIQEYELVRELATCLRHEKLLLFFLDNPLECLKLFPSYTWDEEADAAAEEFIQWYVERFRAELEEQRDIDLSGPAFGEAGAEIERWRKDLTNDEREVVIAIDLKTGETLFVRYGDEDSVTLHDEQKKLVEDRYVALLHHHPNNSAASLADLDATKWMKAEFLLVSNQDGTLHRYARVGEEMIPLEPTRNPEYAAPADPLETALADAAYLIQTLSELGNPPERVMRQGEEQVVIDAGGDTRITLPPLESTTLEVSQKLAEHLWNNLVADFENWAYESYGYVPQAGTPEYFDLIVDLTQKWWTFSEKETSRQRDAAYTLRYKMVERAVGIQSGIKFFHAAQTVNHIMSLGEYAGNIIYAGLSDTIDNVTDNFNQVGKKLIDHNDQILAVVLENEGKLPSPYHNSLEDFDASTAIYVDTAIDWDIHMVWREHGKVGEYIDDLGIEENDLKEITDLFGLKDRLEGGDFAIGESAAAIDWAARAVGSYLAFDQLEDRITLGVAMIFQKQGYDEDEFKIYYDEMMKWVNRQAGQDKFRLPKVEEVLPQYD